MRLVVLHGSNDTYGASRVLLDDCTGLVAAGHEVEACLPCGGPLTPLLRAVGVVVTEVPLHVLRLSDPRSLIRPPTRLPSWRSTPDVVVLWTLALMAYLPVVRAHHLPVLVSVHELLPSRPGGLLAAATKASTGMVQVNSTAVADWLTGNGLPASRVSMAYPAAPARDVPLNRTSDGTVHVGLLGRVNGTKGHLEAVEMVELARQRSGVDVRLTLAGAPFPGQERHLQALRDRIHGRSFVRHIGEVGRAGPLLRQLDLLLVWSQRPESFGLTPLEAWAAGCRTVSNGAGGAAEAAWLVDGLVVDDGSSAAGAAAIRWAVTQPRILSPPSSSAPVSVLATHEARATSWRELLASV